MGIEDLYIDYGIDIAPEGHKHFRENWINVPCPFCVGSEGYHLGFNTDGSYFYCWRCGGHPVIKSFSKILNVPYGQAEQIAKDYRVYASKQTTNEVIKINKLKFQFPTATGAMTKAHKKYLSKRGFDPDYIEQVWHAKGTQPQSHLDNIPYGYRILIPVYWNNQVVTFQCRDYTGKQETKYMACPTDREIMHHKDILYGLPNRWSRVGVCVEGVMDVWKLGRASFCTFGIAYTPAQVRLISQLFDKIYIIFDPEPQAQSQAKKLKDELKFRGTEAIIYTGLKSDPGDLATDEAKHLIRELKIPRVSRSSSFVYGLNK